MGLLTILFDALILLLLVLSALSDVRRKRIPKTCSFGLLGLALLGLLREGEYLLAGYFILSVLATGSSGLRYLLAAYAAAVLANLGEAAVPFLSGLAAADLLFALKIIGGGDAQLLYALLAVGYRDWKMAAVLAALSCVCGTAVCVRAFGLKGAAGRIRTVVAHLRSGNIGEDAARLRVPLALITPAAYLLFRFV